MSDPFDRVLRDAARRGRTAGVCPDAAMLAAYVDDGLAPAERREVELHASGCVSCQTHLALLGAVSVEPAAPVPARSWFPRWGWLVPVATAVIVAAVWVRLPEQIVTERPAPVATEAPASVPPAPSAPAAPPSDSVSSVPVTELAAKLKDEQPVPQKPAEALGRKVANEAQAAGAPAPLAAAPAAPPAPVASPPAAFAQDALQEERKREVLSLEDARAKEADAGQRVARLEPTLAKSRGDASAPPVVFVVSASDEETFRAIGGRVDRSTDGGKTWQHAFTSSGGPVTAAACAGGTCWFGTSDGRIERNVRGGFAGSSLPVRERVDAIAPTAPESAVVTTRGGRKFRTANGGATWTPEP